MSRPPTMAQLLTRAGLGLKRPRPCQKAAAGNALGDALESKDTSSAEAKYLTVGHERQLKYQRKDTTNSSVEEKIAALERELEGDSSSSSNDCNSTESEGEEGESRVKSLPRGSDGGRSDTVAKLVSSLNVEKIEPLPSRLLPRPGCGILKVNKLKKKAKKRPQTPKGKGLESAVKELLENYQARSSERIPFYCRICKFQGNSLEGWEGHKLEPLHIEATKEERKLSSCSLCKKQFTSPHQLKEHLTGKAHIERSEAKMLRQGKWLKPEDTDLI